MDEKRDTSAGSSEGATGGHAPADETFAWTGPEGETDATAAGGDARATAERMLGQLQSMIDQAATLAAPVVRQVGAKAAELAAVAADRAGPIAHRAADATADASGKLAVRSRTWAAELRSKLDDAGDDIDAAAGGTATAVLDGTDDAIEEAAKDDPAEGSR
ncbi:MAG TPA: hypothetical protein VFY18_01210 [Candidatus Limnocylindrales bacterium]|nr:hypothetical protein [Candidatus Limnocylindrales bacterium]